MAAPLGGDFSLNHIKFPGTDRANKKPVTPQGQEPTWQPQGDALSVNFAAGKPGKEALAPQTAGPAAETKAAPAPQQASRVPTVLSMDAVGSINGFGPTSDAGAVQGINGILSASGEGFTGLSGRQYTF